MIVQCFIISISIFILTVLEIMLIIDIIIDIIEYIKDKRN